MKSIVELHADLRASLSLSSEQAAEHIALEAGNSLNTVYGWLSGKNVPINTLKWLNAAFTEGNNSN